MKDKTCVILFIYNVTYKDYVIVYEINVMF